MTTYRVRVKRWERGWELHIDDDAFIVEIEGIEADAEVDAPADRAGQVQREAERVQREAVRMVGRTVAQLQRRGLNNREIARYLRISPQRVSQISARQRGSAVQEEGVGR